MAQVKLNVHLKYCPEGDKLSCGRYPAREKITEKVDFTRLLKKSKQNSKL